MKKLLNVLAIGVLSIALVGCEESVDTSKTDSSQTNMDKAMDIGQNSIGIEMRRSETIQKKLTETQPQPQMDYSLERQNIIERTNRWNEKNKISYIYLMSDFGSIVSYFPIKGKVSSVNSALSSPEQVVNDPNTYSDSRGSVILSSPQEDGSYGTNGDAIYFFLTDGTYMEWNGKYFLSDQPVKLSVEPLMTYEVKD